MPIRSIRSSARAALAAAFALAGSLAAAAPAAAQSSASPPAASGFAAPVAADSADGFVLSNLLFIVTHELGHVAVSEFDLPVLGREEDAADTFAALAMMFIGTERSTQAAVDAARGLYLIGRRDRESGVAPDFFGEHGLDKARAFNIACLLVGAQQAPTLASDLTRAGYLDIERARTCEMDYEQAEEAWLRLLRPHLRASGKPSFVERLMKLGGRRSAAIDIAYGDAPPALAGERELLARSGMLEKARDFAQETFAFPRGFRIEARACGRPDASWDPQTRRVEICYEMASMLRGLVSEQAK